MILALMGLFVFKQPNGQSWLTVDDFLPNTLAMDKHIKSAKNKLSMIYDNFNVKNDSQVKIYRWKDSNGNWSYSDEPIASIESEEVVFDPKDIVVLPALDVATNDLSNSTLIEKHDNVSPNPLTTTPSKVLELYKNANNVQKLMDERQQKISKAIKDNTD
mgnify:CR=1 FL=1